MGFWLIFSGCSLKIFVLWTLIAKRNGSIQKPLTFYFATDPDKNKLRNDFLKLLSYYLII